VQGPSEIPLGVQTPQERNVEEANRPYLLGFEYPVLGNVRRFVFTEKDPHVRDGPNLVERGLHFLDELLLGIRPNPFGDVKKRNRRV
jgi:hypothetical protein